MITTTRVGTNPVQIVPKHLPVQKAFRITNIGGAAVKLALYSEDGNDLTFENGLPLAAGETFRGSRLEGQDYWRGIHAISETPVVPAADVSPGALYTNGIKLQALEAGKNISFHIESDVTDYSGQGGAANPDILGAELVTNTWSRKFGFISGADTLPAWLKELPTDPDPGIKLKTLDGDGAFAPVDAIQFLRIGVDLTHVGVEHLTVRLGATVIHLTLTFDGETVVAVADVPCFIDYGDSEIRINTGTFEAGVFTAPALLAERIQVTAAAAERDPVIFAVVGTGGTEPAVNTTTSDLVDLLNGIPEIAALVEATQALEGMLGAEDAPIVSNPADSLATIRGTNEAIFENVAVPGDEAPEQVGYHYENGDHGYFINYMGPATSLPIVDVAATPASGGVLVAVETPA